MNSNLQMSFGEFLPRAARWGLVGGAAGLKGLDLVRCTFLGPIAEKVIGFSLEDILITIRQEYQKRERQKRLAQKRAALQSLNLEFSNTAQPVGPFSLPLLSQPEIATSLKPPLEIEEDSRWRDVVAHPSIVLILGKRGSGKSALGYRLLELFSAGPTTRCL